MPCLTWILFDSIKITLNTGIIILAVLSIIIYNEYTRYIKMAYGVTDGLTNEVIVNTPKCISVVLVILALNLAIDCKWI